MLIDKINNSFSGTISTSNISDSSRRNLILRRFLEDSTKRIDHSTPILANPSIPILLFDKPDLKIDSISTNFHITSTYYTSKDFNFSKGLFIKDDANKEDEDILSLSLIVSDNCTSVLISDQTVKNKQPSW